MKVQRLPSIDQYTTTNIAFVQFLKLCYFRTNCFLSFIFEHSRYLVVKMSNFIFLGLLFKCLILFFSGPSLICCISGRKATGSLTMVSRVVVSILEVPTLTFIIYQLTLTFMKSLFIVQSIGIYQFCVISILFS